MMSIFRVLNNLLDSEEKLLTSSRSPSTAVGPPRPAGASGAGSCRPECSRAARSSCRIGSPPSRSPRASESDRPKPGGMFEVANAQTSAYPAMLLDSCLLRLCRITVDDLDPWDFRAGLKLFGWFCAGY